MHRDGMMLTHSPGIPGNRLTVAPSKMHPNGASVASLRLFMIDQKTVHVRRSLHKRRSSSCGRRHRYEYTKPLSSRVSP